MQYQPHNDRGPDENFTFSNDAPFGSRSLMLQSALDGAYHTPFRPGPTLELIHPLAFDKHPVVIF